MRNLQLSATGSRLICNHWSGGAGSSFLQLSATRSREICNRSIHLSDRGDLQLSPTSVGRISNLLGGKTQSRSAPFCHGSGLDLLSVGKVLTRPIRNYPQLGAGVSATTLVCLTGERTFR